MIGRQKEMKEEEEKKRKEKKNTPSPRAPATTQAPESPPDAHQPAARLHRNIVTDPAGGKRFLCLIKKYRG
jgi:hypothetical protein